MGTVVEVRVDGSIEDGLASAIDGRVVAEIMRLEAIFSAYDPSSELERWKRGEVPMTSAEFAGLLAQAREWQVESDGAFNPAVGVLSDAWGAAAARGTPPDDSDLRSLADSIRAPRYDIDADGSPRPVGDCARINFNAVAKGWIVDQAVAAAVDAELGDVSPMDVDLVVNAGGDLVHRGPTGVRVGIENPFRPYDNEPPLGTVLVRDAALATSGRARQGFRIDGRWYSHVIDPRTGRTADDIASISVIAPSGAEADVLATIAGVMAPTEAVEHCTQRARACLVIGTDRNEFANDEWRALSSG